MTTFAPTAAQPTASPAPLPVVQDQILAALATVGGSSAPKLLFRATFGIRWEDVQQRDRNRYLSNLAALERKGLLAVARRWGVGGYGQAMLITLTDAGRTTAGAALN
jgi:hypothetical protein